MMASEKVPEFFSAIRGYHYYRNTWNPEESEVLQWSHELENAFDLFTIKTCKPEGQIAGHLPMEIARLTKFLLDRGAVIIATLNTTNYRRSPLVQGGLEIACKVTVRMPGTIKNHMPMDRYLELARTLYAEPKDEIILESFLCPLDVPCASTNEGRKKGKCPIPKKKQNPNRDMRTMFLQNARRSENRRKSQDKNETIVIN